MLNKAIIINNQVVLKDVSERPTIMIDKSTLETLSNDESGYLGRYYDNVSTHVLLSEIGADLKKEFDDDRSPEHIVSVLAYRLHGLHRFNTNWYTLLGLSLLGHSIPIDSMAPIYLQGIETYVPDVGRGIYLDEQEERKTLWAWASGEFNDSDYEMAEQWRSEIQKIDLASWHRDLSNQLKSLKAKSLEDIPKIVEDLLNNSDCQVQLELLKLLVKLAKVSEECSIQIFNRWNQGNMPLIQNFSQYGYYCLKVYLIFWWALFSGLVGPRSTHCIDLHYLLELPFCRIFSSKDNFHVNLAPLLLTDQQEFVNGWNLKCDLKRIKEYLDSLSEEEKTEVFPVPYPPDWDDSVTSKAWRECVMPRDKFTPFTQEEKNIILERHRKHQAYNFGE